MKRILFPIIFLALSSGISVAQEITFALDKVDPAEKSISIGVPGTKIAQEIHYTGGPWWEEEQAEVLFSSFATDTLHTIGEDVLFQMLLKAWSQHRPVVLTPDAIWMVICQGFSHYVNENPEKMRAALVSHEGRKELAVRTGNLLSEEADWEGLIDDFTSGIEKYTTDGLAATLVADFSTTGPVERIASEITLMDTVKPYFEYVAIYAVCGIPSITLAGTPDDWKKVLQKTRTLSGYGLQWWVDDLVPILEQFVKASEGDVDYWFWKDIVRKTRPRKIQGPTCSRFPRSVTKVDGWFLKLFPFGSKGRTPKRVPITHTMMAETVCVPFRYDVVNGAGAVLSSTKMELIAGLVGVSEDPETLALTPKIGWLVRRIHSDRD